MTPEEHEQKLKRILELMSLDDTTLLTHSDLVEANRLVDEVEAYEEILYADCPVFDLTGVTI